GDALEEAMFLAAREHVPFIAITATGGARMQEGMAALAQMPRTVAAARILADAGIPRITVLGNPTTGGVYASFACIADVVAAVRGATIGFAGPRVAKAAGAELAAGSHTAESAFEAGLADALLAPDEVGAWLEKTLGVLVPSSSAGHQLPDVAPVGDAATTAWDEFRLARHPGRPSPRYYAEQMSADMVELRGDRSGTNDPEVFTAIARISDRPALVIAAGRGRPAAGGYRKATRAIEIATRLRIPIVTIVDTPGADPGSESEYGGLAHAIATTFDRLLSATVPVISIVTGEGGSGGALALACGDVIAMQEHAVFSVIGPEGAAAILYRDADRAAEVAPLLKPTSRDLLTIGIANELIAEPAGGAHSDPAEAAANLAAWTLSALVKVKARPQQRVERFREAGRAGL
ncbi:MAG TPA: carboxyl transferase domain-containing protein, partial [Actinomycetota bacterium]|nr:carboxyl transferase domain-containing protein [Actinomycetota bacterium]